MDAQRTDDRTPRFKDIVQSPSISPAKKERFCFNF